RRDLEWDLLPDVPIARVGDVAAGVQARTSAKGRYVLAEVRDTTPAKGDRVTFTVDGVQRVVTRSGGVKAAARRTDRGYRVEALLPAGSDLKVTVRDEGGAEIAWTGKVTAAPAVQMTTAAHRAPVVDGVVDRAWAAAPEIRTGTWIQGTSGATAKVRTMWNGSTLYVLAQVRDPALSEESANPWEQDSVEIFVDPGNGKTKGYDDDDGQYRISFSGRQTVGGTFDAAGVKDNLTSAAKVVPGGYVVEAAIVLPTVTLAPGTLLGFDVQVNDASGAARTSAVTWNDATGRSFVDTGHWGVVRLRG
ncbi:MAG: 1,4-beta-xylanase, partial [Thermoactinospora sp.]|nr:1,4-beta-xylanase [Thermoactinospora sp.]